MSSALNVIKSKWRMFSNASPLLKGMISYSVIWPTANVIQQTFDGKNLKTYDWFRVMRYSLFGTFYVAPTLHCWIRLSTAMWPQMSLRIGVIKAVVEQFSYGPFACASFFFVMSLLELKTPKEAAKEVKKKFLPTFETGVCIWPFLQTINFSMIPERNRIVFVSICSLMWITFLAYMQSRNMQTQTSQIKSEKESES